MIQNKIKM